MERNRLFSIGIGIVFFGLLIKGNTGNAAYLQDNSKPVLVCNDSAKVCKDTAMQEELKQLSDKLGVALDSTCDRNLMETLASWIGTPYHHAGYSKKGIDCSGFVSKIYKDVYGISLTHSSSSMIYQMKERVKKEDLQPGDILFFRIHGRRISHVGIYLKDGKFIHASLDKGIAVDHLDAKYYKRRYYTAGRPAANPKLATN